MYLLGAAAVIGCAAPFAQAAHIALDANANSNEDEDFCSAMTIRIDGEIGRGDAGRLATAVQSLTQRARTVYGECFFPPTVLLNSDGGDLGEALTMGMIVREARLATDVPVRGDCFSSCVFVFAAGVDRKLGRGAQLGIHRPFLRDLPPNTPVETIRRARSDVIERVREYLQQLDVSPQLLDAMLAVPPGEIKLLEPNELRDLRIIGTDAAFEEYQVKWNATMFDLASSEFRQRNAIAQARCDGYYEPNICVAASILGIALAESQRRWARYSACKVGIRNELVQRECFRRFMTHGEGPAR